MKKNLRHSMPLISLLLASALSLSGCGASKATGGSSLSYIEETAVLFDEIAVSAGIRGAQVILNPEDLKAYTEAEYASLTVE